MVSAKEYLLQYPSIKINECSALVEVGRSTQVSGRLRWVLGHQADAFVICRASRNASCRPLTRAEGTDCRMVRPPLQNRLRSWTV